MALDLTPLLTSFFSVIRASTRVDRIIAFGLDDSGNALEYQSGGGEALSFELEESLRDLRFTFYEIQQDSVLNGWLNTNTGLVVKTDQVSPQSFALKIGQVLQVSEFLAVPLRHEDKLAGVIIADNYRTRAAINPEALTFLQGSAGDIAQALTSARSTRKTIQDYADGMHELYILRQIDRELNDTIELNHVFDMTLDWALRFTNAQVASVALYDENTDDLRVMVDYGWDIPREQVIAAHGYDSGIAHRVARSGRAETIPDVSTDAGYVRVSTIAQSLLSVPVMREDRVVAVITIESKKINGFSEKHLDFVEKLATRAGVAIDNARLFADVVLEREKLSHILGNIADVVIVVGMDDRVILINQSALHAMYPAAGLLHAGEKRRHGDD
jgi:GAF domain-containing protein